MRIVPEVLTIQWSTRRVFGTLNFDNTTLRLLCDPKSKDMQAINIEMSSMRDKKYISIEHSVKKFAVRKCILDSNKRSTQDVLPRAHFLTFDKRSVLKTPSLTPK